MKTCLAVYFPSLETLFLEHGKNPEIANLEFESHVSSKVMFCSQLNKLVQISLMDMIKCKICLCLYGCKEIKLHKEHIVQCRPSSF